MEKFHEDNTSVVYKKIFGEIYVQKQFIHTQTFKLSNKIYLLPGSNLEE